MNTVKLNKNSWHYRLATVYTGIGEYDKKYDMDNLCAYTRWVLKGIVAIIGFLLIGTAVVLLPIGLFVAWLAAMLASGQLIVPDCMSLIFPSEIVFVLTAIGLYKYSIYRQEQRAMGYVKPDNFIVSTWKAHHDKFCAKVEFK